MTGVWDTRTVCSPLHATSGARLLTPVWLQLSMCNCVQGETGAKSYTAVLLHVRLCRARQAWRGDRSTTWVWLQSRTSKVTRTGPARRGRHVRVVRWLKLTWVRRGRDSSSEEGRVAGVGGGGGL